MYSDKKNNPHSDDSAADSGAEQQGKTLEWLLDMDLSEPNEALFVIDQEQSQSTELSEAEAEVANRPMFRGNGKADDLTSYVEEEIVLSEVGFGADIYGRDNSRLAVPVDEKATESGGTMAIDHSRKHSDSTSSTSAIADGLDILGLREDDTMGEQDLMLRRTKPRNPQPEIAAHAEPAEPVATAAALLEAVSSHESTVHAPAIPEQPVSARMMPEPTASQLTALAPAADQGQLADYLANQQLPVDESEFDRFLVAGGQLEAASFDLDELFVDPTEGVVSVDPAPADGIDYPDDFSAMQGFNPDAVAALAQSMDTALAELTAMVAQQLTALQQPPDSVEVEVTLVNDADSARECAEQDFSALTSIFPETPNALRHLATGELEAVYVRLRTRASAAVVNDLFGQKIAAVVTVSEALGSSQEFLADDLDALDSDNFEFDLAPDSTSPMGSESNPLGDIDFGDLDDWDDDEAPLIKGETPLVEPESNQQAQQTNPAVGQPGPAVDATAEPIAELQPHALAQAVVEPADVVFDEDLFAGDVSEEYADLPDVENLDDLLESLADDGATSDAGDICGVAVEQFDHGSDSPADELSGVQLSATDTAPRDTRDMSWCIPGDIKFSVSNHLATEIFKDFLDAFIEEGASELEKLEDAIGEWEHDPSAQPVYDKVTRILHTLKGIAKGVGLQRYGTFIHNFETLLDGLARPAPGQREHFFQMVNAWLDTAVSGFETIKKERGDVASELPGQGAREDQERTPAPELVSVAAAAEIAASLAQPASVPIIRALQTQGIDAAENQHDKQLADEGAQALVAQQTIRMTSEALDHLLNLSNQAQQLGVRASQSTFRSKRAAAELLGRLSSVRAHIGKIADRALLNVSARGRQSTSEMDALEMDQYSELQEAANILREGVEDLDDLIHHSSRQTAAAEAMLKQQTAVITSLGSSIRAARVVPLARLMPGLRRTVRTVGADLAKSASFRVLNEAGKLDRDSYACCQIILEHMVRNALDHGIESAEDRLAAGKATSGLITIDVSKHGSDYQITLTDDGRGIDPESMREAAYERGLDIDVAALTDREAIRLIFHKGFSTASSLSEISGRGVGMDIVLSEVQQLGGDIEIESTVGEGTAFKVRIPSNVTVNGALLVTAGETSYAIPLDGLIAVENVPAVEFFDAVEERRELALFGMKCTPTYLTTLCYGEALPDHSAWASTVPVIIAGSDERFMAIAVDDVQEALELVIRSLGNQFTNVPGVAGGATTADGQAIVALDLNTLVANVPIDTVPGVSVEKARQERLLVLVVDDSRTQRMVATSQFDTLGVETVTAENGMVAIDFLNTTHRYPDVILLDVEMPVKDGIQTLREIRKSDRYSKIPVIMVTSRTGAKHRSLAQAAGCNGYMGKPFNFPVLVDQISQLTGHKLQVS